MLDPYHYMVSWNFKSSTVKIYKFLNQLVLTHMVNFFQEGSLANATEHVPKGSKAQCPRSGVSQVPLYMRHELKRLGGCPIVCYGSKMGIYVITHRTSSIKVIVTLIHEYREKRFCSHRRRHTVNPRKFSCDFLLLSPSISCF